MAESCGFEPKILNAVEDRNHSQKLVLFNKIVARFGADLKGLTFGVWGLAFKPGTDDMREASSLVLIRQLIEAGAKVRAYDPVAMDVAKSSFPRDWQNHGNLVFADHQYDAIEGSDAMILVTEWKSFRIPDFAAMSKLMNQPVIFDGRNQYEPAAVKIAGFEYWGIGRRGSGR